MKLDFAEKYVTSDEAPVMWHSYHGSFAAVRSWLRQTPLRTSQNKQDRDSR
jgi:hypothetical protein